ncbi:MAG: NUDIX hydrolase [Terrimicrobiaceae bacterium]|nr:NUDIX hydrolase [Terrimicrobiaceae bacterium]
MSGWREIERATVVDSPYLRVYRERVATPTRPHGVDWMVTRRKQAVVVAPRTPDGRFLLIRQERIPVRREMWEFPAGQVDGEPTPESILATAHRELAEEVGCHVAGAVIPLGSFFSSVGFTDEQAHLFLATDVLPREGNHAPDDDEAILECRAFAADELREWVASGAICDANTLSLFARLVACGHI